jgi:glucose/arabinose dehydrogenase
MKKAGAVTESANRITSLRGLDANGAAQSRSVYLQASTRRSAWPGRQGPVRGRYRRSAALPLPEGDQHHAAGVKVMDLPAGTINHHWTKNIIASPDGKYLYVTVGSNSNVAENGIEAETGRAAIWQLELATSKSRLFATGLRNANGMGWEPQTNAVDHGQRARRTGQRPVPDYMTSVKEGGFYGWPYSYYGQHVDTRVSPQQPELVAQAIAPGLRAGRAHGLAGPVFYDAALFPQPTGRRVHRPARLVEPQAAQRLQGGVHSVQRRQAVRAAAGFPDRLPQPRRQGAGPAGGVAVDQQGALLVADDVGNVIWRVAPAAQSASR